VKRGAVIAAAALALGVAPLVLPEFYITQLDYIGLAAIAVVGVVLLTGVAGQTSFGQAAFVGMGAYTTAYLTTAELPAAWAFLGSPWLALLAGLVLTAGIALVLGLLTLRLSGHYLPLGTIAWGISIYFLLGNIEALGGHTGIGGIPALGLFGFELRDGRQFSYLIWLVLAGAIWISGNLLDSRHGRAIRAVKGGALMAEAMGADTQRAKLIVFLAAALFACVAGWLYAHMQRFVNPTPFGLQIGIEYLFMAVVGGAGSVWGAVAGAAVVTLLKQWLQDLLPGLLGASGNFEVIVFGVLIVLMLQYAPGGLWPLLRNLDRRKPVRRELPQAVALPRCPMPLAGALLLQAQGVRKLFGGLVANANVSLEVHAGEVVGLIGPNGAGKTTFFDLVSGTTQLTAGQIRFRGERTDGLGVRRIARRGMSRSFQHVRLLPDMSVLENVALGCHRRGGKSVLSALLHLERGEERCLLAEASRQLERVGLAEQMFELAGSLALGQQRLLEIARALCADPCLLLLDEPAAGLRYLEKLALADLLRRLRSEGMGILLVEHDVEFVMGLVDRCVVMEFGEKIAEGSPREVQANPAVLAAYLGEAA
jgi:branched-chain amino acid transport system permease protein